jgi:Copper transport outer membrane protein, MctB
VISFRFHLVSITAVFLAIAIGVVIGSTFVDRAIVDGLENRIDSVSNSLDQRRAEISDLRSQQTQDEAFARASADFIVPGRLAGRSLVVLAERGVDETAVRNLVETADAAGAVAPGIVWIEPRWGDDDSARIAELARIVGVTPSTAERIRTRAWRDALTGMTRSASTGGESASVMSALADAGYLSFEAVGSDASIGDLAGTSPILVAVTGPEVDEAMRPLLEPMVATAVEADVPVVLAEVYAETGDEDEPGPARGETVTQAVPEGGAETLSVVDHLDLVQGRIAAVLAASDLIHGVEGRYGYGDGAGGALPAWTSR